MVDAGFFAFATCLPVSQCTPGDAHCVSSTQLETCNTQGVWVDSSCQNGCAGEGSSATCTVAAPALYSGTVLYAVRGPNATYPSDWTTTTTDVAAPGLLVMSMTGCNTTCQPVDSTTTDATGAFSVHVPASPGPGDELFLIAASYANDGALEYMVGDPQVGMVDQPISVAPLSPKIWSWSAPISAPASGVTFHIGEAAHSGALRVFDYVHSAHAHAASQFGGVGGLPLVAWLGYGTSWDCGSCFSETPTSVLGHPLESQIWFDGTLSDERWWSDAVTAHELGHWVMASYGLPPGEGGKHCFGELSYPGLAWSEGWATWHSCDLRSSSVFYDKQEGTMFYWDLDTRVYSPNIGEWQRPSPSGGLLQLIDENDVASQLWSISRGASSSALYNALVSPRMTSRISQTPSLRGYTRHSWTVNSSCLPIDPVNTGVPAPCLADMLDALDCSGVAPSIIDAATDPVNGYPYDSASPACQAPAVPLVASWVIESQTATAATVIARIEHRAPYPLAVSVDLRLPDGVRVVSGEKSWVSPPAATPRVDQRRLVLAFASPLAQPVVLTADAHAPGFGLHAERPFSPSRSVERQSLQVGPASDSRWARRRCEHSRFPVSGVSGFGPPGEAR